MLVSNENYRQVLDLQRDALIAIDVDGQYF